MVFMGDTGSLALGGALGTTAVAIKHEIVLAVIGGLFVLEAVSVIVQVTSFAANTPIICDIEIFARELNARAKGNRPKIIAITGTNGKSTTTALTTYVLAECDRAVQMGGNIGRGVLDLDRMHAGMVYVLELSSYQLERCPSLKYI